MTQHWFIYAPATLSNWVRDYIPRAFHDPEIRSITVEIRDDLPIDRIFITQGPLWPLKPTEAFGLPHGPSNARRTS